MDDAQKHLAIAHQLFQNLKIVQQQEHLKRNHKEALWPLAAQNTGSTNKSQPWKDYMFKEIETDPDPRTEVCCMLLEIFPLLKKPKDTIA